MSEFDESDATLAALSIVTRLQMTARRIVIADDDPDSLDLLRRSRWRSATVLREATNGSDLMNLLVTEGPFDLIVTDVHMPPVEGLQVLRAARLAQIQTPVPVVTGLTRPDLRAKFERLGRARVCHKPLALSELRGPIAALQAEQV